MKKILIIDDSDTDQFYSEFMVHEKLPEVEIIKAYDGQEAMEIIEKCDKLPDLILLDINMPRMNGHEFLKAFSKENTIDVPVVAMLTSSDQEQDKEQAMSYKCVKDYLLKPIKEENILHLKAIVEELTGE